MTLDDRIYRFANRIEMRSDRFYDAGWKRTFYAIMTAADWIRASLCLFWPHQVIDDQCNNPEHRYCYRCNRQCPNQPTIDDA